MNRSAHPNETDEAVRLDEGRAAMGVWLPLAFASLVRCIIGMFGNAPEIDEVLDSWLLPEMAEAARNDRKELEAREAVGWFEKLEKRYGKEKDK